MAVLRKRAWWFWPWIVGMTVLFVYAFGPDQQQRAIFVALCVLSMGFLYLAANAHEKKVAVRQVAIDKELLQEMLLLLQSGQELHFSSSVLKTAGLAAVSLMFALMLISSMTLTGWLAGLLLVIVFGFLFLNVLMRFDRPAITVSVRGMTPYIGCFVEWKKVAGIHLEVQRYRGAVIGHRLIFKVDYLPELVPAMTMPARLYFRLFSKGAAGSQVSVDLDGARETPALIRDLCEAIWSRTTKRNNTWHPGMPDAMYSALQKMDEWQHVSAGTQGDEAVEWAKEGMRRAREASMEFEKEKARRLHWTGGGAIPAWVAILIVGLVLIGLVIAFVSIGN